MVLSQPQSRPTQTTLPGFGLKKFHTDKSVSPSADQGHALRIWSESWRPSVQDLFWQLSLVYYVMGAETQCTGGIGSVLMTSLRYPLWGSLIWLVPVQGVPELSFVWSYFPLTALLLPDHIKYYLQTDRYLWFLCETDPLARTPICVITQNPLLVQHLNNV